MCESFTYYEKHYSEMKRTEQPRFTAHLHGSLLSQNDNNNNTLAALQKISTEVIESDIQSLWSITKKEKKTLFGVDDFQC